MKLISSIWLILLSFGLCNAQFAVLNPESITSKGTPLTFTINDFDGDGRKDIAYLTDRPITLTVIFSESNNSFTEIVPYTTSGNSFATTKAISSGDINKDGKADIIFFDNAISSSNKIIALTSKGRSFEQIIIQTPSSASASGCISLLDWDGDSNLDLMV